MCPLQSFWMKVQPLTGNLCNLTWNSICRSSSTALAPSSGDDAVVNHTTATLPSWTMDQFRLAAMRAVSTFQLASSSWLLGSNVILRMQDSAAAAAAATAAAAASSSAPLRTKPLRTTVAICEADQRAATQQQRRRATTSKRLSAATTAANSVLSSNDITATPLQQSQQILQAQDYILHQIPPPPTPLVRRLSKEWVSDYKHEARIDKINYNNIFGGVSDASNNEIPILSPPSPAATASTTRTPSPSPTLSSSSHDHQQHLNSCPSPSPTSVVSMDTTTDGGGNNKNMMLWPKYFTQTSSTSSVSTTSTTTDELSLRSPSPILSSTAPTTIPSSSSLSHHQQESSLSSITTPSTHDVICGRGGKANTHPGNISFRTEAKKLREWYDSSSKSEKFTISSYLVDIVRERGGRFLMRDKDSPNVWHEAESGDVRKKASQALREGRAGGGG